MNNRGESTEHRLLKIVSKRALEAQGYDVQIEDRVGDSIIDVVAKNEDHVAIVECEALRNHQRRNLKTRFKEALLSFPRIKRVLCIPRFVDLEEIWVVDLGSGDLMCYLPQRR